ncbi:hypothetical protein FXO38_29941 [Capsicum annuum]|nr:hypothetical protein FXO38_29941 [Capsicum annuum]
MKKKNTESFREYVIRWREQVSRVKRPMKESKIVEVFIQAQDKTYYQHLLPALGNPFIEVLKIGEIIEDGIKTGRIVSFATLKATTQAIQKGSGSVGETKNEEDTSSIVVGQPARSRRPRCHHSQDQTQVHAQAPHNHSQNPLYSTPPPPYPVYQSFPLTPQTYQNPSKPDFRSKPNDEMRQKSRDNFTPIGESYASLFQRLVQWGMITSLLGCTLNRHSRNFDPNVRCAYHSDA